jgi:hypothetical protein
LGKKLIVTDRLKLLSTVIFVSHSIKPAPGTRVAQYNSDLVVVQRSIQKIDCHPSLNCATGNIHDQS